MAAEILMFISNLETDGKCNVYLAKLKRDIEENLSNADPSAPMVTVSCAEDINLLAVTADVKGYESQNEQ